MLKADIENEMKKKNIQITWVISMCYTIFWVVSFKHFVVETLGASSQAHATKLSRLANPRQPCRCPPIHQLCMHWDLDACMCVHRPSFDPSKEDDLVFFGVYVPNVDGLVDVK